MDTPEGVGIPGGKQRGAPEARPERPQLQPLPSDRHDRRAGAWVAHRDRRGSATAPRTARAECRGFCSWGPPPSPGEAPGCERDVQALGEAAGRRCGCCDPSQLSQLNTKGRRRNVQSLPAEGAARPRRSPRLGWHPGGRRPRGGGGLSQEESGGGRKGETGRLRRQREARRGPGLPSYPDSSPGLERKARTQISSGLAAFSVFFFFPTCSLPPSGRPPFPR